MEPNWEDKALISAKLDEDYEEVSRKDTNINLLYIGGKRKVPKYTRQREEILNQPLDVLPTDISDSTDSDENKIPYMTTTECDSLHEGRQLVHTILPINIETLFSLLFSKSKFLVDFHSSRKSTDTFFGEWCTNEDGLQTRTVNVTMQLAASIGPKTSKVTEYQVMRNCSKPGELYSIDINSLNAGIPYADSFNVLVHYCLVKTVNNHTMLSVHAQVKYKKSIWGVVKGFIEKNAWVGLEDFYTALLYSLQNETCIPAAKGKGRRPRKGVISQIRKLENPSIQTKAENPKHAAEFTETVDNSRIKKPQKITKTNNEYRWLMVFIFVLLCALTIVNILLLLKLCKLEHRIKRNMQHRTRLYNLITLKYVPNIHYDSILSLRQQYILYDTDLKKWQTVLKIVIELLEEISYICESIYNK